jgi:alanine racemase
MDFCMVNVDNIPQVAVGDEVILFGNEPSVDELAQICNTINYEIICGISSRVPRVYKVG